MQAIDLQWKSGDEILGNRSRRQQRCGSSRGHWRLPTLLSTAAVDYCRGHRPQAVAA
jgi:hypothetical protein